MGNNSTTSSNKNNPTVLRKKPSAIVSWTDDEGDRSQTFYRRFVLGRDEECDIVLDNDEVSRQHFEVVVVGDHWFLQDLGSTNGTIVGGQRIEKLPISDRVIAHVGDLGPKILIDVTPKTDVFGSQEKNRNSELLVDDALDREMDDEILDQKPQTASRRSVTQLLEHYLKPDSAGPVSAETADIRAAFARLHERHYRSRRVMATWMTAIVLVIAGLGGNWYYRSQDTRSLAVDIFYSMKELELTIARLSAAVSEEDDRAVALSSVAREQLVKMQKRYDDLLGTANILDQYKDPVDELIVRLARSFGECEIKVPQGFVSEVKRYISIWQKNNALPKVIKRAAQNGYTAFIEQELERQGLPVEFFFIALQESQFNLKAVGPKTRYGIAKGMWQFIPSTGEQYGLKPGPSAHERKYDEADERFDFKKSTRAATRYLAYIYGTEAAASGLLVVASYNWGENRVRSRIRKMSPDPRERNFWAFTGRSKIPDETYNYVYRIFSAAVISANPELFGFNFVPPLRKYRESAL